jgi:hypothetical protein
MYVPFFPVPLPVPFPFYASNGKGSGGEGHYAAGCPRSGDMVRRKGTRVKGGRAILRLGCRRGGGIF